MATEKELNKILSKIYKDLESLQNAREQVEKVTNSSNGLTLSTSKLAKDVKSFADSVKSELLTTISVFTEQLEQSGKGINSNLDISNTEIKDKIKASDQYLKEKIKNTEKDIRIKLDAFKEDVNKLRDVSKVAIDEVTSVSKKSLENQNQAILATIDTINKYVENVQSLIDVINKADISGKLEELKKSNKSIFDQSDENKLELKEIIENENTRIKQFVDFENSKLKSAILEDNSQQTAILVREAKTIKISIWAIAVILVIMTSVLIFK